MNGEGEVVHTYKVKSKQLRNLTSKVEPRAYSRAKRKNANTTDSETDKQIYGKYVYSSGQKSSPKDIGLYRLNCLIFIDLKFGNY